MGGWAGHGGVGRAWGGGGHGVQRLAEQLGIKT